MKKAIKFALPISLLLASFCSPAAWLQEKGPFDIEISKAKFDASYIHKHHRKSYPTGYWGEIQPSAYVSAGSWAMWEFLSKYADEMEEGADYMELEDAIWEARVLNRNRKDNVAYAAIGNIKFYFERKDGKYPGKWYRMADIIQGDDWDNDGYIDVLEGIKGVSYTDAPLIN